MKKKILINTTLLLITFLWVSEVFCVPSLINYQGRVTDKFDNPINDNLDMRFKIYDQDSGGNFLWGEKQAQVTIVNGVFNILLGKGTPIDELGDNQDAHQQPFKDVFTGTSLWLEVQLDLAPISPRQQIVSVGYAMTAGSLGDTVHVSKGNVGIGTKTPGSKLDVNGLVKLRTYSFAPTCTTTVNRGSLALNYLYKMCVCNGNEWVHTSDGTTLCEWEGGVITKPPPIIIPPITFPLP